MRTVIPFNSGSTRPGGQAQEAPVAPGLAERDGATLPPTEQQLLLLQRLIGCTDVRVLLERFHYWAQTLDLANGLHYSPATEGKEVTLGTQSGHNAHYDLNLDALPLGNLSFFRRTRFGESELATLEEGLGSLARCLRAATEVDILQQLVTQDPLTGVGNRSTLDEWISREVARARRHQSPLAVMMIDVDHFKAINDRLGHLGGDRILRAIARILRDSTRRSDLVFRFGGDEFTLLLPHTDARGAAEAASQIRRNLARLTARDIGMEASEDYKAPDVSIGIASYQDGDDEESLMQRADTHLYHAKARGRARVCASL